MNTFTHPRSVGIFVTTVFAVLALCGAVLFVLWQTSAAVEQQQQAMVAARRALGAVWEREFERIADTVEESIREVHGALTQALALMPGDAPGGTPRVERPIRSPKQESLLHPAEPRGSSKPSGPAAELATIRERFDHASREFALWLKEQRRLTAERDAWVMAVFEPLADAASRPRSPHALLEDLEAAFEDYSLWARVVLEHGSDARVVEENKKQVQSDYQKIQDLARAAHAQIGITRQMLLDVDAPLTRFRQVRLFGMVGLGVLFGLVFLGMRCFLKSATQVRELQHKMELLRKDLELEHQQQLSHFGQMAAALAHEIRNPLTAMSARIYTLQKTLPEGSAEYRDTEILREEVQRLDRVVQDFLRLARPADPKPEPLALTPMLESLRDLLAGPYQARGLELRVQVADSLRVRADEAQLKQVLLNLIRNAAEAMPAGGTITLRARREPTLLRQRATDAVILEVTDTGPGIPPEVQEHLFTPFFSTKENGTGLGLAIAAKIINKHGGELRYETRPHQGTTFRIVLPANGRTS